MYYIYTHTRPDTGNVFYVGRGKMGPRTKFTRRAHSIKRRNHIWDGIVRRNAGKFTIEIVFWTESREEVLRKEIELISKYGKLISGAGTLCNLTDGGDGSLGLRHSDEARAKLREAHARNPSRGLRLKDRDFIEDRKKKVAFLPHPCLGKKASLETRKKMSEQRRGSKHPNAKSVVDTLTGIVYGCVEDAAAATGHARSSLHTYLKPSSKRANPTTLRYVNASSM